MTDHAQCSIGVGVNALYKEVKITFDVALREVVAAATSLTPTLGVAVCHRYKMPEPGTRRLPLA